MRKTKYWMLLLLALLLACSSAAAGAEIIPSVGMGQVGFQAVVLCHSLTVRESRDAASRAVNVLHAGDLFITQSTVDGWCNCFLHENQGRDGWVKAEYVAVDPAWYRVEKPTPVYPWNREGALRVGLLEAGEKYPVLMAEGEWIVIGLRGASGWIHDPQGAQDALQAVFRPDRLPTAVRAALTAPDGKVYSLNGGEKLQWIRDNFSIAQQVTATGCPFDAELRLTLQDGSVVSLAMATDSCRTFRTESGVYYQYGTADSDDSSGVGNAFWAMFGLNARDFYR